MKKVVWRGNDHGYITGKAGTAYRAGKLGHFATDTAATDYYTFDCSVYGDCSNVVFEFEPNEVDDHDGDGADGDDVRVIPLNEISFMRAWCSRSEDDSGNLALLPGNKLTESSAVAGCVQKVVDATLSSNSLAYGFASSTAANATTGQSLPNYVRGISWTSLASVASADPVPILMQVNLSW
ncbi:MAG: hypothetical protein JW839_02170 [Candidatus Lokiarchaeota archaeon]|nr:hypothetical protein [Candidatus Lokiarchaeota archaeon]